MFHTVRSDPPAWRVQCCSSLPPVPQIRSVLTGCNPCSSPPFARMSVRFKYRSKHAVMRENTHTPATLQNTSTKDGEDSTMAKTKTELYDELVDIETSLENHPLTSGKIAEANIIIEQMKEQGATPEEINEALIQQGLPSLVEIGKSTLLQSFSLWKLNHRKLKVEAAIEKLNRKEARRH